MNEADKYVAIITCSSDVSARKPFTKLHIYSPDTDVFLLTIHKYPVYTLTIPV